MKAEAQKHNQAKIKYGNALLWALPIGIAVLTFWCYHYSLGNQFTNWDDDRFVTVDTFITSFSSANLKQMLFHDVTGDYYNPITILSYALNYHFSGLAPESYYLTNIIIHILNSCLLFFLTLMLLKAMERNGYGSFKWKEWLALFCTLAYAIHPMHVESVSWAAERKDVLYAFFYFAGLIAYIKYITKSEELRVKSNKDALFAPFRSYFLVVGFYLLSLLSKPMAVVFPFSLLAIDVLLKRDKTASVKNIIIEKLPFIVVSVVFSIVTYHLQKLVGAVDDKHLFSFFQRFLFASYSFYMYIVKAIIPVPLSSFYPYPVDSGSSASLPFIFYISPLIALLVASMPLYFSYRSGENNFRITLFGLGFYFFNMVIVSQIIGSGPTIMSDRYSYMCYFGIFFPATCFIYQILEKGGLVKKITTIVASIYLLCLTILCYERTFVWHNSETLWTDVLNKYGQKVPGAYEGLGQYYFYNNDMEKAYSYYREAVYLKVNQILAYHNMGYLMFNRKQYDTALYCYSVVIKMDSANAPAYLDRGNSYFELGMYDLAMKDYRHYAKMNPNSEALLRNMGVTYMSEHQYDSAIICYTHAIQINPANPLYFHCRGVAEFNEGALKPALNDFIQNLNIAPHDSECMFFLSVIYSHMGNSNDAYKYAQMALNARYPVPQAFLGSLKTGSVK